MSGSIRSCCFKYALLNFSFLTVLFFIFHNNTAVTETDDSKISLTKLKCTICTGFVGLFLEPLHLLGHHQNNLKLLTNPTPK
jgi:hypothetical protein